MNRKDLINEAYKDLPKWAKQNINDEGWIPHRYLLELLSFYKRDEIDFIDRDFVRPKILRKINLKLTYDQIFAVSKLTHQVYDLPPTVNPNEKEMRSIAYDIADKFMNKYKSIIKKGDVFDKKKTYKMALKFNEAKGLYRIIFDLLGTVNDVYYRAILDRLKNEIEPQIL
ncbi:hypothetical protein [Flavobacterium columnare]|uniref:hypothetical protein n=1 Tax=Flavobacterium columnare TaxID=996 RepID=UPI001BC89300|nr:hypothetical protein [Flavobacterium columnare]AUX17373.1 hypothetical protein AQ623_02985 [Flavobacterium columnare]